MTVRFKKDDSDDKVSKATYPRGAAKETGERQGKGVGSKKGKGAGPAAAQPEAREKRTEERRDAKARESNKRAEEEDDWTSVTLKKPQKYALRPEDWDAKV